ncbi:MAG: hypothetical protein U0R19_01170 [Bryobacteraceae bacterium]
MYSDLVRDYVRQHPLQQARARGLKEFSVVSGDVHKALGLTNRVPTVCQALRSKRLLRENNLILKSETGPPSGLSTTMVFTYSFASTAPESSRQHPLRALAGAGKKLWADWGGGEAFLKKERSAFRKREHR